MWSGGLLWGEGRRGDGGERGKSGNGGHGREELEREGEFGNFARSTGERGEEEKEKWDGGERKVRGFCRDEEGEERKEAEAGKGSGHGLHRYRDRHFRVFLDLHFVEVTRKRSVRGEEGEE